MKKNSFLTVTDQFCGAGGSSQGARRLSNKMGGGLEVKLAMNHWKLAIETHNTNFPDTEHDCADISASDPRRYQSTDILITSPECTNHSLAKGRKRKYQQTNTLFGELTIDPAAERSRATMWDVPRFAEIHKYNLIIVENVVEARQWVMWEAWLHAMSNLGYQHKCVYLNSMHTHPVPQSRDRMYIVFWKKGNKAPDLEYRPKAFCQNCASEVESIQTWKNPRRKFGKFNQQYVYRCPRCANVVEPYYYAAFNVIDWSIPGTKIGDRAKPLAKNTIKRIQYGLEKYGNSDFLIYTDHTKISDRSSHIFQPISTQTTAQVAAIVIKNYGGAFDPKSAAFKIHDKLGTVTTTDHHGIVGVPVIIENNGTSKAKEISKPIGCITAGGINHGILSNEAMNAFLSYYYGNAQATGMNEATGTITTKDRLALVMKPEKDIRIEDCTYRMLKPHEIQRAMAFADDYVVCGNSRDKVKQLGNAVTPPAMEWLLERGIATFN
ncbi:MAG: DNA cytosine methyltransferase [Mangrovibacterium sp.]